MTEWAWRDLDRGLWFEGRGNIRKWAGYGLAHRLVAEHLSREPELDPLDLIHAPAETLRPAMRRLSGALEAEPESEAVPAQETTGAAASNEETASQPDEGPQAPAKEAQGIGTSPQADGSPSGAGDGEPPPQT